VRSWRTLSIFKYSVNSALEAMYSDFDARLGGCLQEIKKILMNNERNCEEGPPGVQKQLKQWLALRACRDGENFIHFIAQSNKWQSTLSLANPPV
jgi:hypothetical protein